jgi:hypothetical protein
MIEFALNLVLVFNCKFILFHSDFSEWLGVRVRVRVRVRVNVRVKFRETKEKHQHKSTPTPIRRPDQERQRQSHRRRLYNVRATSSFLPNLSPKE